MTVNTFSRPQCKIYKHFSFFLYLIFPNQTIIEQLYVFLYYFIVIRFDWHAHYLGTMSGLNKVVVSCRKVPQIFLQWQCIFYIYRQYNAFTQDETTCMFIFSYLNIYIYVLNFEDFLACSKRVQINLFYIYWRTVEFVYNEVQGTLDLISL